MDRDWVLIILLGFCFGSIFYFQDIMLNDVGPLTISLARTTLAAVFSWAFYILSGQSLRVPSEMFPSLVVLGLLMFVVPFAAYPLGQQYIATGLAGIVNAMTPIMVIIVSHFWPGGDRVTRAKVLGVAAGFAGIILLSVPALGESENTQLVGIFIILAAPVSFGFALNWNRRFATISPGVVATWSFTFASLCLLPVVLLLEGVPGSVSAPTIGAGLVLGVLLTGGAFHAAFRIMVRAGPTKMSSVTFIVPISALMIGWLALGESLLPLHFAGMAAIFLGLVLIDDRWANRKTQPSG